MMGAFDWVDTYQGLIVPVAFSSFGTFLLRQFFLSIPQELEDAARIDGASHIRILLTIFLPLSLPVALGPAGIVHLHGPVEFVPLAVDRRVEQP